MKRLIKIAALAVFILWLPVSVSIFFGRQQPVPYLPEFLHLTDCKPPCWIGIVPGKTTLTEARDRILAVYGSTPGTRLVFDPGATPSMLGASLGEQNSALGRIGIRLQIRGDGVVATIAFDFGSIDKQVALADLYALYGAPPGVARLDPGVNSPNDLAFVYGDEGGGAVVFAPPDRSMPWTQDASLLIFYADHDMPLARSVELQPWPGFSQLMARRSAGER